MKQVRRFAWVFVAGLFVVLTMLLFWPMVKGLVLLPLDLLVSSYRPWVEPGTILLKNPYMQDSVVQMFPWKQFVFSSFRKGIIPFWNPYQHDGMPFMATMKPMVFYPLSLLGFLGDIKGWNMLLWLQVFLSMSFSYLLCRSLGIRRIASIFGAISYSMSSLMIGVLEFGSEGHVLLWLPLMLFCIKNYVDTSRGCYAAGLGGSVALSIFAGQLQYAAYMLAFAVAFVLYYGTGMRAKLRVYLVIGLSLLAGLGMTAIQLGPAVELFRLSARSGATSDVFLRGLIEPYKLARLLSPDFFGNPVSRDLTIGYIETSGYYGIIPLLFTLYAMGEWRKKGIIRFFVFAFLGAMLLSLKGIGATVAVLRIPLVTSGSGDRIFALVLFCGSVLAAFGLDRFLQTEDWKGLRKAIIRFAIGVGIIVGFCYLFQPFLEIASRGSLIAGTRFSGTIIISFFLVALLWRWLKPSGGKIATLFLTVAIVGLTYLDLYRMAYRFLTFSNPKFLYPETPLTRAVRSATATSLDRVYGLAEPEFATNLRVYTSETYNPLYLKRHALLDQTLLGKRTETLPTNKYYLDEGNGFLKRTLDFLGTKYFVTEEARNLSSTFFATDLFRLHIERLYKDDRYALYRNLDAVPRFGIYYDLRRVTDEEALRLLEENTIDFGKTLLVEDMVPAIAPGGTGSARLVHEGIQELGFDVTSSSPGMFYLSDTYYPGWRATVNGTETKIYRANYDFRAVPVPAGKSTVVMVYTPTNFGFWVRISAASAVLVIGVLFLRVGKKRGRRGFVA